MSQPHENLVAWQRADDLCVSVHRLTRVRFPSEERFRLSSQLRRAAYSVAANIAEGYADPSKKWRLRYLRIAVGSLAEVGYGLHLAKRLGYLNEQQFASIDREIAGVAAPLHGLVARIRQDLRGQKQGRG